MASAVTQALYKTSFDNTQFIRHVGSSSSILEEMSDNGDILRELNRMRMRGIFCNAVLATYDGGSFRVHKVVMCWCSSFFRTLFTTSLQDKSAGEGQQLRTHFLIPDVPSSVLETIIIFAYTGIVDVSTDNVNELLPIADQLDVAGMVKECIKFMLDNIKVENCLGVWRFGKEYLMLELETEARR